MTTTLGVLVAGGQGIRLGLGTPKALVPLAGRTLLERALAILESACDEVVVVAPPGVALPVDGARRVDDVAGAEGPLAGVVAGLAARAFERAFVLGVDFPLFDPRAARAILTRLEDDGAHAAVIPVPRGILQPLAAAYAPAALAALAAHLAQGERSISRAVRSLALTLLDDAALEALPGGRAGFFNVNTPDDLATAQALALRGQTG